MAFGSSIWLTIRLSGQVMPRTFSQATREWLCHTAVVSGCHLPTASRRAPTELWEVAKLTMCIFTSEWPQVGTMGVFKASQMILYRHLRLTFL